MTPRHILMLLLVLASHGPCLAQPRQEVTFRRVTNPQRREELMEHLISVVPDELNIAQRKPVKALTGQEGGHKAEYAVDGNRDRGSAWWGADTPTWLQVDLGRPVQIGAARVFFHWGDKRYYQYTIDVSLDEKAWQTVVDESRNTTPSTPMGFARMFPPVRARFVRVHVLKNSANTSAHIVEFKVYAHEGGREPGHGTAPATAKPDAAPHGMQLAVADNKLLQLYFAEGYEQLVTIRCGGKWLGSVCCAVAQFEKKGIGYKGTGVGSARATVVKKVDPVKSSAPGCIVDVTAACTRSKETMRKFEATYRFTLQAGQSWFESRLLQIRNTDTMPYELRGYCHLLQPANTFDWAPHCFSEVAGWIGRPGLLGAMVRNPDDFVLGLRNVSGVPHGEIAREIRGHRIDPGMIWQDRKPGLIIFGSGEAKRESLVKEFGRIKPLVSSSPAQVEQ